VSKPVLVLEDDVDIEADFLQIMQSALSRLPDEWAVLWVGSCFEERFDHEKKVGHRCACCIALH
jgi:GR25 family glycosyltransferase involved in LPS biosynthesis